MSVAGLVTGHDVTLALVGALTTYLPRALVAVQPTGVVLRAPVTFARPTMSAARLDAAALPAVVVSVTGTEPVEDGSDGQWLALAWSIDVGFLIRSDAGTYEDTMRDAALYGAAISTVLLERGTLGGFARGTFDLAESYDEADPTAGRTLAEGHVTALVVVDNARRRGVRFTLPTPGPADGVVTTTTVTVQRSA